MRRDAGSACSVHRLREQVACFVCPSLLCEEQDILSSFVLFLETGYLCGTALAVLDVLEFAFVDQTGLELIEICLPLPLECWG